MSETPVPGAGAAEQTELQFEVTDAVATITLNRPAKLNTMTPAMGRSLRQLVDKINDDDGIRVVVLTGMGNRAFSAGSDVKVLDDYGSNWQLRNRVDYARMLWSVRKPVIAKIRGYCIGGGLEMALMSDIRVGDATASFAAGEIKLGWHGGAGNTQLLPRVMSSGRSLAMLLTGDKIDAPTAHDWGLLDYLTDPADLDTFVADLAGRIARNAPIAAQLAKHLVRVAQSTSLEVGLAYENDTFAYCFTTADAAEGRQAFADKRPPEFRGR